MSEVDAHRRPISTAARLNPEEISNRAFSVARRGYAESEVRAFLRRVADDLGVLRERERQLAQQVEQLETKLRNPEPPTERQLLDSLGEETARVLRSAQEAAEDIRGKAAEKSAQIVHEAQESARSLREEAESFAGDRRRDAEEAAAQLVQTAEARASELRAEVEEHVKALREETDRFVGEERERATGEIATEIESARERGREMLNEARAVRERVLADLTKRRGQMQHQIEELRGGREQMLDAYRVVRRTLGEAADALAGTEGVDAVLAAIPPVPAPAEATTSEHQTSAQAASPAEAPADAGSSPPDTEVEHGAADANVTNGAKEAAEERPRAADVFARLRAGRSRRSDESAARQERAHATVTATATATDGPGDDEDDDDEAAVAIGNDDEIDLTADTDDGADPDGRRLRARDEALAEPGRVLLRIGKRALQDEQNDFLDALRRQKGNINLDELLPARDAQHAMWLEVLRNPLGDAYAAGFTSSGASAKPAHAPDELVGELAATLVDPLRERLAAVDASSSDAEALTQQIGSRYREWKSQSLQPLLEDALAVAYSRGVYESTPSEARLRWVPARPGQCPDCDDNALEPTPRGKPFPTGQPFPPAHPGCRCLLVAVEADAGA